MLTVEIIELGSRLRARRTAAGRTIASVALDAGLSVPYIANLENGRGNPTLSAVTSLAAALGVRLSVDLIDEAGDATPTTEPSPLPESLLRFARSQRFTTESARLTARQAKAPARSASPTAPAAAPASETATRQRLLQAMAGLAALATRPLAEADWHRLLDAAVLMSI
jgi:transcriptional regulator with XRE-family HTH domain